MIKKIFSLIAWFIIVSLIASNILAATYYSSPLDNPTPGNDTTGDGSLAAPWATVYKFLTNSSSGDSLKLLNGTFDQETGVVDLAKNLTISPYDGNFETVIIKPKTLAQQLAEGDRWIGMHASGGGFTLTISNVTIDFDHNYHDHPALYHQGILDAKNCNIYLVNCFLRAANFTSWNHYVSGIFAGGSGYTYSYKNTFRGFDNDNTLPAACILATDVNDHAISIDDIFYGSDYGIYNKKVVNYSHCSFYNNSNNLYSGSPGAGNITADPLLSGSTATLLKGSPCIDAGVTIPGYVESYLGDAPEIGCWEGVYYDTFLILNSTKQNRVYIEEYSYGGNLTIGD